MILLPFRISKSAAYAAVCDKDPETEKLFLCVFRSLCTVFGTGLSSLGNTCCIKCTSDDMVSGTRKVLYPAAADQYNAVLLKVVSFTRDVACYFDSV